MKGNGMKYTRIVLVCLLILGILSSAFGVAVAALTSQDPTKKTEDNHDANPGEQEESGFVSPLEQYGGSRDGEVALDDRVSLISEEDAKILQKALVSVEAIESWGDKYTRFHFSPEKLVEPVTEQPDAGLTPEEQEQMQELWQKQARDNARMLLTDAVIHAGQNEMIFLPGDTNSPLGGNRIYCVRGYHTSNYYDNFSLDLYEAYFEDAFKSIDICATEALTEDKLISAAFAPGVSAYFGDAENTVQATPTSDTGSAKITRLAANGTSNGNHYKTEGGDLVVTLDYELDSEENNGIETGMKLTGSFGIRDLQAHLVCKVEEPLDFQELYCGLSGQVFANVAFNGSVEGEASADSTKLDAFFVELEGLNEKRFPIAVFQFQGTTPVYITNTMFEATKDSVLPNLYVVLYADWEGKISMTINTELNYAKSFNSGLRVFKNGELKLGFEEYPYPTDFDDKPEDGLTWNTTLTLAAETDLTLFGGSVLFYVAGVNLGEICAAKVGVEAKCDLTLTAGVNESLDVKPGAEANAYIRGYLKLLEAKLKLKVEGKTIFENWSKDIDFQFCVLDKTLFVWGKAPDQYKKKYPVSTMERPEEFESVLCLVCDVSGSMAYQIGTGQTKLDAAKEAAIAVVGTAQSWDAQFDGNYGVGVVKFNYESGNVVLPHNDYTYIKDSINTMEAGGGTNVCTGIEAGFAQLDSVKAANKVMVVMTDGQDEAGSSTITAAQNAANAGITIYTIGFGEDVNEDLLKQLAEIGGGEYRYANTDSIMGIVGSFLYAQQSADAEILTEMESTVAEGETSKRSYFTVKDSDGDLRVATAWPGSFLDTILVDPNGREVDENYPDATTDESMIPSTIVVKNPIPGKWSVRVKGIETSYDQEPFYTIVAFKESDSAPVNKSMSDLQAVAAWCLPLGFAVTLSSAALLIGLSKKKEV